MTVEKQKFTIVGGHAKIAGRAPDENGHVHLSEREALYERALGRLAPVVDVPARRSRSAPKPDVAPTTAGEGEASQDIV